MRLKTGSTSRFVAIVLFFGLIALLGQACGGEDIPNYGGPSGLTGRKVPDPVSSFTPTTNPGAPAPCNDGGISTSDAGATCAVSFATTIFAKYMAPTGTWQCTNSNCHGPTGSAGTSANSPTIDATDPAKAYAALAQYPFNGKPYINGCTTDPSGSAMDCNLNGACTPKMPETGSGVNPPGATPAEIQDVETWLKCGAPLN